MSELYEGKQHVGIDVHRRRSVLVRMSETGEKLEAIRISNDPERLREVMSRAGEAPEVVLDACYGWYWAADLLAELGASVHLAHPLVVQAYSHRRVKNDERDAADLADLLRMNRLPEAWIAPPAVRELRDLVRHRAKLVSLRTSLKNQVHAVLAAAGVPVAMSDVFGAEGAALLDRVPLASTARARVDSARRLIDMLEFEIDTFTRLAGARLRADPGYLAVQTIPGIGPILAAVLVAEIGEVTRFARPEQLTSWAGLTPRHHESDTTVHRGAHFETGVAAGALGRGRVGAAGAPDDAHRRSPRPGRGPARAQHRHRRGRPRRGSSWCSTRCAITTSAPCAPSRHRPRERAPHDRDRSRVVVCHDPHPSPLPGGRRWRGRPA